MPTLKQDLETVDQATAMTTGPIVAICHTALKLKTGAAREFLRIALANAMLMDRKQQDYGPQNIIKGGVFGCLLRASDKFERLFNLFNKGRARAINESKQDSIRDISNYMNIALQLELGHWPNYEGNMSNKTVGPSIGSRNQVPTKAP